MMKQALRYAFALSEDPRRIKENVEDYLATAGCDRRYKFKWRAVACNHKHTFSGIFEYAGQRYYFNKHSDKTLELEKI